MKNIGPYFLAMTGKAPLKSICISYLIKPWRLSVHTRSILMVGITAKKRIFLL
nr:hypothetical protein [Anaerobacterium chartisolvens]